MRSYHKIILSTQVWCSLLLTRVGIRVGPRVPVGFAVGFAVGFVVGFRDGFVVGTRVGLRDQSLCKAMRCKFEHKEREERELVVASQFVKQLVMHLKQAKQADGWRLQPTFLGKDLYLPPRRLRCGSQCWVQCGPRDSS